jgi:hypothetical protein
MFCSTCGAESVPGLSYCKRCGANLGASEDQPKSRSIPLYLVTLFALVIAGIGGGGLGAISAIVDRSAEVATRPQVIGAGELTMVFMHQVGPIILCTAALSLGIVALLVWLLLKILNIHSGSPAPARSSKRSIAPPSAQLPAPARGVASVTEQTTRNFDSILAANRDTADM